MRFNNVLVCLILVCGVLGARSALCARNARVVVHLRSPDLDLSIGGKTVHHASGTETFVLDPGEYDLQVRRGTRQLYSEHLILGEDDERVVTAWWL